MGTIAVIIMAVCFIGMLLVLVFLLKDLSAIEELFKQREEEWRERKKRHKAEVDAYETEIELLKRMLYSKKEKK